ncbi:MAG: hypothetical protein KDA61_06855, partial [Planctomycetales bacterium]|nr:hypothetical protein [Planctomycetales bacterium]
MSDLLVISILLIATQIVAGGCDQSAPIPRAEESTTSSSSAEGQSTEGQSLADSTANAPSE